MFCKSVNLFALTAVLFQVSTTQAQIPGQHLTVPASRVTTKSGLDHCYHKLSGTGQLTAYAVKVPAHGSTLVEPHPQDYLLVAIKKADLSLTGPYGNAFQLHLEEGGMQVVNGGWAHRVSNLGDTDAVLVEIDVQGGILPGHARCGLSAAECSDGRFGKTDQGTYSESTLFETPTVKLSRISLGPGGVLELHRHVGPEILLRLTPAHLASDDGGLNSPHFDLDVGDARSFPSGTAHQIRNAGTDPAQFLEFERK